MALLTMLLTLAQVLFALQGARAQGYPDTGASPVPFSSPAPIYATPSAPLPVVLPADLTPPAYPPLASPSPLASPPLVPLPGPTRTPTLRPSPTDTPTWDPNQPYMPPTVTMPAPTGDPTAPDWHDVKVIDPLRRAEGLRSTMRPRDLTRFGSSFFSQARDELTGDTDSLLKPDYLIHPGDQLTATAYNIKGGETTSQLQVDSNGRVLVPGVGEFLVGGMTSAQAQAGLENLIRRQLPNMRVRLDITYARKIRVFLLGSVAHPGGYLVNPDSTVIDALLAGGGPNQNGTYRSIQLQRYGRVIQTFDLYQLLISGKTQSPRLIEGDRVFVPAAGPQVSIAGPVNRPAIFELKGETTLAQLIKLAGGVRPEAYGGLVQLERISDNMERVIYDIPLKQAPRTRLKAGDYFLVREVLDELANGVYVDGAVQRPGWYSLRGAQRVSQLLAQAQGMKDGAFPGHAEIYRLDAPDKPIKVIGIELDLALRGDPRYDIPLQKDDRVVVYDQKLATYNRERVRVQGEVTRPGEYTRYDSMKLRDLLYQAGGLTPNASGEAEVARRTPVGLQTLVVNLDQVMMSPDAPDNLALSDLDTVMVRKSLNARLWPAYITLDGEVKKPGVYAVDPTKDTLQSVLARAGGLTENAYPAGAVFVRNKVDIMRPENERLSELIFINTEIIARQIASIQAATNNDAAAALRLSAANAAINEEGLTAIPRVINRILATNRIPLDLADLLASGTGDPGVRDGDILVVPQAPTTVVVAGAVNLPSAVLYRPGTPAVDYIRVAGGRTKDAEEDEFFVMRANGEMLSGRDSDQLAPGDSVLVPPAALIAEPGAWERFLQVFQVAVGGIALWRIISR